MDMKKYDLTTQSGIKDIFDSGLLANTFPLMNLLVEFCKSLFTNSKEQAKAVEEIIKNGKEQGVDSMEITINNIKGLNLDIGEDVQTKCVIGSDEKMHIHVKYK